MLAFGWLLGARASGRAELDPFVALHPAALLALTMATAGWPFVDRAAALLASLVLATLAELAFVALADAPLPLGQALRGAAGGVAIGLLLDAAQRIGRAAGGRAGPALGAVAGLALLLAPQPVPLFRRLALTPEPRAAAMRPRVALLTGLPLRWDEHGPAGTLRGGGNAALRALERRFHVMPIGDAAALAGYRLALLAQPRPPGPAGLVAIDTWVRAGGRLVLLVDPDVRWASDLPPGDPRRPPRDAGLAALLAHWGVTPQPGDGAVRVVGRDGWRLVLPGAGRLRGCGQAGVTIACRIGRGRVVLIADADLLEDRAWIGEGALAESRGGRLADNPAFVAALLDRLAGRAADPADRVRWATR